MKKRMILVLVILTVFLFGCSNTQISESEPVTDSTDDVIVCPESCSDNNECTTDLCSEATGFECQTQPIIPCCGNGDCEEEENFETCSSDCKASALAQEIVVLKTKADEKVESYEYIYKLENNKDLITYYIKGEKIKAKYSRLETYNDFGYDTVYLDLNVGTGVLYCRAGGFCDLDGQESNILLTDLDEFIPITPFDMLSQIDNGEVVEHISVDDKKCDIVEFTDAEGITAKACLWDYYGMPLRVEYPGGEKFNIYYSGMVINSIQDKDVIKPEY